MGAVSAVVTRHPRSGRIQSSSACHAENTRSSSPASVYSQTNAARAARISDATVSCIRASPSVVRRRSAAGLSSTWTRTAWASLAFDQRTQHHVSIRVQCIETSLCRLDIPAQDWQALGEERHLRLPPLPSGLSPPPRCSGARPCRRRASLSSRSVDPPQGAATASDPQPSSP